MKKTFSVRALLACVTAICVLLAAVGVKVVHYYQEQARIRSLSLPGTQVFTEPRGHLLYLSERFMYIWIATA